jgi:chemotaxis protein MotB
LILKRTSVGFEASITDHGIGQIYVRDKNTMRRIRNEINIDEQETARWLISYADLMTLLFAFFVVLYSISQVNAGKYKDLSEALEGAFDVPRRSHEIIPIGEINRSLQPITGDNVEQPELNTDKEENAKIDSENFSTSESFKELENGLEKSLGDLIDQELAEIKSDANWINIVLKSALLFPSGSDSLNLESDALMEEVTKHLNTNLQLILVHGHTDNIPINTEQFPSNWELSSARAVAVVRKLQNLSVQPNRLSVEGHGEFRPIADNTTLEGRAENRRVVISISRKQRVVEDVSDVVVANTITNSNRINEVVVQKEKEAEYKIIKLPGGGILIRGKDSPESQ